MKKSFTQIQAELDSFKQDVVFQQDYKIESLADVLDIAIKRNYQAHKYNRNNTTIYKGTNKIQCWDNRNRSDTDIYRIAKSYIPEVTFENVYNLLHNLSHNGKIYRFWCRDVKKMVSHTINFSCADPETFKNYIEKTGLNTKII